MVTRGDVGVSERIVNLVEKMCPKTSGLEKKRKTKTKATPAPRWICRCSTGAGTAYRFPCLY